ncbi:winged helix-turn-helix domain-containing protein [Streptomyces sp. NPDC086033]|uniref:winged helix-turn-helix domain-containing protein n=1 Tax=Streptomyces sp. NPDC086033 TaxID=3365747 RepID=UPI0037CCCDAF
MQLRCCRSSRRTYLNCTNNRHRCAHRLRREGDRAGGRADRQGAQPAAPCHRQGKPVSPAGGAAAATTETTYAAAPPSNPPGTAGLRQRILSGRLKPGEQLPAVRSLQQQYALAGMPVRAALHVLRAHGLVDVVHGRGSCVADPLPQEAMRASTCRIETPEDTLRDVLSHILPHPQLRPGRLSRPPRQTATPSRYCSPTPR